MEDCIDSLLTSGNQEGIGKTMNTENDVDIVVESEEVQNSIIRGKKLNELEHDLAKIELDSKIMLNNQQTFAGAIKKTNRKLNNFVDVVDSPRSTSITEPHKIRFHDRPQLRKICTEILEGIKVMIIMRGPPGCGKLIFFSFFSYS